MLGTGSWKTTVILGENQAPRKPSWITPLAPDGPGFPPVDPTPLLEIMAPPPVTSARELQRAEASLPGASAEATGPASPGGAVAPREETIALTREIEALRAELARARAEVEGAKQWAIEAIEPEVVKLACVIAERIVDAEIERDGALLARWVREGLDALGNPRGAVIAIAPDLAARSDASALAAIAPVETDPALAPAHCEVRAGASVIEVGPGARVAAIADDLGATTS